MPRSGPGPAISRPWTRIWPASAGDEAAEDVEQRALAAAARADHRDELAVGDRQAPDVEHLDSPAVLGERLAQRDDLESQTAHGQARRRSRPACTRADARPSRRTRRLRSQQARGPLSWPASPTRRERRTTVSTRGRRRAT